jgi:hypothetical protein
MYTNIRCESIADNSFGRNYMIVTNGIHAKSIACDGIELIWDQYNFARSGKLTIYGYSKS